MIFGNVFINKDHRSYFQRKNENELEKLRDSMPQANPLEEEYWDEDS